MRNSFRSVSVPALRGVVAGRLSFFVLLVLLGAVAISARAEDTCTSCHDQGQKLAKSAHSSLECTSCHEGVTQGPDAGIPSVSFCMACHQAIAVDNPEIKKLTAYADKGQDVPWQRVYWFYPERHVRFWHSPHINAGVNCKECHGDLSQQTVAVRSKDLNMNFCLSCHRAKGVSVDCTTCHY